MSEMKARQWTTVALVVGAVAFGMVLAGGIDLTMPALGAPAGPAMPGQVSAASGVGQGLPGFADLAEAVSPAVVSIRAVTIEDGRPAGPFEFFFGPRGRGRQQGPQQEPQEERRESGGSGFLISSDGLLVTNNHVVEGATTLFVHLGEREYPAEVKGIDPATDIALLKIEVDEPVTYLALGDSNALRVGDWVMAIGSPLRLESSVTVGVVSAKGRALGLSDRSFEDFIQTDAAINFGNSGGPLVNLRGEVIGINTAINFGAENIGFAVPAETLRAVLPQLKEEGKVRRGYLGVTIDNLDFQSKEAFGLTSTDGALVVSVNEDTPAAEAGVKAGDIILKVDDVDVKLTRDLINYVSRKPPGATVTLSMRREGKAVTQKVKLSERPGAEEAQAPQESDEEGGIDWLGVRYQELTPGLRSSHSIPEEVTGVVVRDVAPRSPLLDEGVRAMDIIAQVNGKEISSVDEFESSMKAVSSGEWVRLYLYRADPRSGSGGHFFAFVRVP